MPGRRRAVVREYFERLLSTKEMRNEEQDPLEDAIDRLTRWLAPLPVVDVYFWESIAGMPDDLADRHVELVATRLAPTLARLGVPAVAPPSR